MKWDQTSLLGVLLDPYQRERPWDTDVLIEYAENIYNDGFLDVAMDTLGEMEVMAAEGEVDVVWSPLA